jgi:hypothetical protein
MTRAGAVGLTALGIFMVQLGASASMAWSQAGSAVADNLSTPAMSAGDAIADWPAVSRLIARAMIAEYGQPDEFSSHHLLWHNNGPWKRTVVSRAARMGRNNFLQQVVSYGVPAGKFSEIKSFDRRIVVDAAKNELSSYSDSEKMNFLALNLAYEIITDKQSPAQARRFYGEVTTLSQAGKTSPYTEGLVFKVANESDDPQPFYQAL